MYNLSVDESRQVYHLVPLEVAGHEASRILPCRNSPLVNFALRTFIAGDEEFKMCFQRVLEKESFDLLLVAFLQATRYVIRYSRQGDPRITQSQGYGVLTPLQRATVQILNTAYITGLFFGSSLGLGLVLLAVERQQEVDWT